MPQLNAIKRLNAKLHVFCDLETQYLKTLRLNAMCIAFKRNHFHLITKDLLRINTIHIAI